jgi:hypothetical protein
MTMVGKAIVIPRSSRIMFLAVLASTCSQVHSHGEVDKFMRTDKHIKTKQKTPWSEFASELYRPSDRRLSAK